METAALQLIIRLRDEASSTLKSMGNHVDTLGLAVVGAMAAAGAAVAGFSVYAVNQFSPFDQGMREAFTLMPGISEQAMSEMSGDVKQFARDFGVLPNDVIPALYNSLSAGVPPDNVFAFLETAQKAAVGGVTELETAVDGITSVVNAYGDEVITATEASDYLFTAVKLGKTTFGEMSASIAKVTPIASALGVGFDEVAAAAAVLTSRGTSTSEAMTQINAAFAELGKDGTKVSKVFEDLAGQSFTDFIASGGSVQEAFLMLEEHANSTGGSVMDLFGSIEAGKAVLALTGKGTEDFTAALEAMDNSAGATDAAYQTMSEGISQSFREIKATLAVAVLEFGERLAPTVQMVADMIGQYLPGMIDQALGAFDGILNIVLPVVEAFAHFLDQLAKGVPPVQAFSGVISILAQQFTDNYDTVNELIWAFQAFYLKAQEIIGPIVDFIAESVELKDVLGLVAIAVGKVLLPVIASLASALAGPLITFGLIIAGLAALRTAWEENFLGIQDIVGTVLDKITEFVDPLIEAFNEGGLAGVLEVLRSKFEDLIPESFLEAFQAIRDTVGEFVDNTLTTLRTALDELKLAFDEGGLAGVLEVVRGKFEDLIPESFLEAFNNLKTTVGEFVENTLFVLQTALDEAKLAFGEEGLSGALSAIKEVFLTFLPPELLEKLGEFGELAQVIGDTLSTMFAPTLDRLREAFSGLFEDLPLVVESFKALGEALVPVGVIVAGVLVAAFNLLLELFAGVLDRLPQIIASIVDGITGFVTSISDAIIGLVDFVKALLEGDWKAAWDAAYQIGVDLSTALESLLTGLAEAVMGIIIGLVEGVIEWFRNLYHTLVGGSIIPDMVTAILQWITDLKVRFVTLVTELFTLVVQWFTDLFTRSVETFTLLKTTVINLITVLKTTLVTLVTNLKDLALAEWTLLRNKVEESTGLMKTKVIELITQVKETVITLTTDLKTNVTELWDQLWDSAKAKIQEAKDIIVTAAQDLATGILSALEGPINTVKGWIDGLAGAIRGIRGAIDDALAKIREFASNLGSLSIPGWLIPGSPTPLEIGLRGIAKAMRTVNYESHRLDSTWGKLRKPLPALSTSSRPSFSSAHPAFAQSTSFSSAASVTINLNVDKSDDVIVQTLSRILRSSLGPQGAELEKKITREVRQVLREQGREEDTRIRTRTRWDRQ